jgi:hypothetical protein
MAGLVPAIRVFFDGRFAGSISCLQRNAWKKDVGGQSKSGRDDQLDSSRAITCSRVTRKALKKCIDRLSGVEIFDEGLHRHAGAAKDGRSSITSESRLITGCVMEAN